jgi:SAM-dependent methyltransferase
MNVTTQVREDGPRISFDLNPVVWKTFADRALALATADGCRRICDLGGGARPLLGLDAVGDREYALMDISASELAKAPAGYETIVADACAPEPPVREHFDLLVTKTLAEHVPDAERFHRNVHAMLRPGGRALHLFPTLYEPAFVLNLLAPEGLSTKLLLKVQPNRTADGDHGKFPARYRWCRGPTRRQLARFTSLGYRVVEYRGYFGHGYLSPKNPLGALDYFVGRRLVAHPIPALCSFAIVELERP